MPKIGSPIKKSIVKKAVANLCKACGGTGKNSRGSQCICKVRLKQLTLPFK